MRLANSVHAALVVLVAATAHADDADRSLDPSGYVERGMPSHERTWSGPDYQAAAGCLEALAREDVGRLPRAGSPRSGVVADRLCSVDNLAPVRNPDLAPQVRLQAGLALLDGLKRVMLLYVGAMARDPGHSEVAARLAALSIRLCPTLLDDLDVLVAGLDPGDPTTRRRLEGVGAMRSGLASMVAGSLTWLEAPGDQDVAGRRAIAAALGDTYPRIARSLSPSVAQEFRGRLGQRVAAERDAAVRQDLERALAGGSASIPGPPTEDPGRHGAGPEGQPPR